MDSADPAVCHSEHESAVSHTVAVAQHVVVSVNRMSVHLHIQDRTSIQFSADPSGRRGKGTAHRKALDAVFLQAPSDHKGNQQVGRPAEHFHEIGVEIDQAPPSDPCDPSEHILRLVRDGSSASRGQRVDQVRDRRRPAVSSVGAVQPGELPGRKAVFISLPAGAPSVCTQCFFEQVFLP